MILSGADTRAIVEGCHGDGPVDWQASREQESDTRVAR